MRNLLVFLFLLPFSLFAQQTFRAGLTLGVNGCQIHGDNDWGYHKTGLNAGGFVCTDPSKKWYGQMEIVYSQKGSRKLSNPDIGDYVTFKYQLNYVEVPFLLRYNAGKIFFEAGETAGFLFKAREWDTNGEVTPPDFRKFETAFIVGLGYVFNDHMQLGMRTTNSLAPVLKFATPAYYGRFIPDLFNHGMYNNLLTLSFNYRLGGEKSE